ncbi:MAG: uncharacterized protein JWN44_1078 [Myxococcales bacterium]|nr:uncharacterized protein [Myxococcales bacterium]
MRTRALLVIPLVVAVLYLFSQALVPLGPQRLTFYGAEVASVKLLATIGCFVAAARFRRGEYLGVAWALLGADYALLFIKDILFGRAIHVAGLTPEASATWRAMFVICANLSGAIASVMLARAWAVAGIALPGSRTSQRLASMVAVIVAVAIVGNGLWRDLHNLQDTEAVIAIASCLGDVVSFSVIAPILLTALAMRGGALAWPWALLTASYCAWLIYDMCWSFERQWNLAGPTLRTVEEFWRAVACALALAGGVAQAWAIRSASGRSRTATESRSTTS